MFRKICRGLSAFNRSHFSAYHSIQPIFELRVPRKKTNITIQFEAAKWSFFDLLFFITCFSVLVLRVMEWMMHQWKENSMAHRMERKRIKSVRYSAHSDSLKKLVVLTSQHSFF